MSPRRTRVDATLATTQPPHVHRHHDPPQRLAKAHGDGGVSAVAFNRDGTQVLSAGVDGVARVWGLRSGKLLKELRGHTAPINAAVYLSDSMLAATAGAVSARVRACAPTASAPARCAQRRRAPARGGRTLK